MDDNFEDLMDRFPDHSVMNFKSDRDMQDFLERDFDRRLEIFKVRVLSTIASSLLEMNSVSHS